MDTTELLNKEQVNELLLQQKIEFESIIASLKEQVEWLKKQLFGKKSERKSAYNPSQIYMFEMQPEEQKPEEKQTIESHQRAKPNRDGKDRLNFPDNLPIETTIIDISEEDKICKITGLALVKIGEEINDKLSYKPAKFFIKRVIRYKYAVPGNSDFGVKVAEVSNSIIPKCKGDETLLAHIITSKIADHLPLYRISEIFRRDNIYISRKLLSQWVVKIGLTLKPLKDLMKKKIISEDTVFIDESPVTFFEEKSKTGYMWVLAGGGGPKPPYSVYMFKDSRKHEHAKQILKGYLGFVHSDKYGAYETIALTSKIVWCPCWGVPQKAA